jgi:hypothetical protein
MSPPVPPLFVCRERDLNQNLAAREFDRVKKASRDQGGIEPGVHALVEGEVRAAVAQIKAGLVHPLQALQAVSDNVVRSLSVPQINQVLQRYQRYPESGAKRLLLDALHKALAKTQQQPLQGRGGEPAPPLSAPDIIAKGRLDQGGGGAIGGLFADVAI